jgi:N-acetylmuramoyl-L-alanine amidase
MKRFPVKLSVMAALLFVLLMLPTAVSALDSQVDLYVDGKLVARNYNARLIEDKPYISQSFLNQELSVLTVWDDKSQTLALERGKYKAQFVLNERYAIMQGETVRIDAPPIVLSNEIYLPADAVSKAMALKMTWDVVKHALLLYIPVGDWTPPSSPSSPSSPSPAEPSSPATDTGSGGGQSGMPAANPGGSRDGVESAGGSTGGMSAIGSIQIVGDQVVIKADGAIQANTFTLTDPNRIVIDIPNSKLGTILNGEPSQLNGQITSTHPHIQRIRYALFSDNPSQVRLVVDLNQAVQYSLVPSNDPNQIILNISSKSYVVVLDAGHGGKDPGAIAYSGAYEKDYTLSLTTKIYQLLLEEPFIKPVLTRSDDTFIELDERAAIANRIDADLFLSIHGNTYIPSVSGTETYYYSSASKYFADVVHQHVVEATGFRDRGVRQQDYKVLRLANMPATLVEVGYISNKEQEELLYDSNFQDKIARAIVNAIKQYLQL